MYGSVPPFSSSSSSFSNLLLHVRNTLQATKCQTHVIFAMKNPFKPTFVSTKTIPFNSRFQDPKFFHVTVNSIMATTNKDQQIESAAVSKQGEEESKKKTSPPPPPPPEKPEPGDCCGSGCVRCVWDVYYEELEEYDKLYKPDSSKS